MAKAKPKPQSTKKAAPKKVIDVAHDDEIAALPASKAVLVNNRPLMHDPMINRISTISVISSPSAPDSLPASAPLLTPTKKLVIKPLASTDVADNKSKPSINNLDSINESAVDEHVITVRTKSPVPPSVALEPPTAKKAPLIPAPSPKPKPIAEVKAVPTQVKAPQPTKTEAANPKPAIDVQALVDSKQFFLPINYKERRRVRQFVLSGLLLIVLLAVAWLDVALDADLISNSYNLPHSHFFTGRK